jgi:hypothetical protein
LIEPVVDGYPPIDHVTVTRSNHRQYLFFAERIEGFADKMINWLKPFGVNFETDARKEWCLDFFGYYSKELAKPFMLSLVIDPFCQDLDNHSKLWRPDETPESFMKKCGTLDADYIRAREKIAESRLALNKLKECLQEAKNILENNPEKLPTDSHSHRYQVKLLKAGLLDEFVSEMENHLNKREQLLNHMERQEKGFFRNFDAKGLSDTDNVRMHYV